MQVWADILDVNDQKIGGPLTVQNVKITRVLDGAGSIAFQTPSTDSMSALLTFERRVVIYVVDGDAPAREIGRGIVRRIKRDASGRVLDVGGPDALGELKQRSVLLARIFNQVSLSSELNTLLGLVGGWGLRPKLGATPGQLVDDRYDGVNVLKAIAARLTSLGQHFRLAASGKVLEYGTFGDSVGITLVGGMTSLTPEAAFNDAIAIVGDLTVDASSEDLCNQIIPVSGGQGEAALNLAHSTRTGPYTILTTAVGPKTVRFLRDDASIFEHGIHERTLVFDIAPIANNTAAITIADNALYDAAVAELLRNKGIYYTYDASGVKMRRVVRPGQKLHLTYKGQVKTRDGDYMYIDVDEDVWVIRVRESFGRDGLTFDLELASIDRVQMDEAEVIIGGLERAELRSLSPQAQPHRYSNSYTDTIQGNSSESSVNYKSAKFVVDIDTNMTHLIECRLRLRNFPPSTQAVGDTSMTTMGWTTYVANFYPRGLRIFINGVEQTATLGGPWGSGAAIDVDIDITDILLATADFRQKHTVEIKAAEQNISTPNARISTSYPGIGGLECGVIELTANIFGFATAIQPT